MPKKMFESSMFYALTIFIVLTFFIVFLGYTWCINQELIIVSITIISATFGYFITHFLEVERKKNEEKRILYTKLVSGLKIFMGTGVKSTEEFKKDMITFEDTYYTSWLYISTSVYEKLVAYMEKYKVWTDKPTEENKVELNKNFLFPLMQAIRDEVTVDKKTEFKNYILTSQN